MVSRNPLTWAEAACTSAEHIRPRRIGAFTHPTAEEIDEAIGDLLPPRLDRSEWDANAF